MDVRLLPPACDGPALGTAARRARGRDVLAA